MTQTISQLGDSLGILIDAALLERAQLKTGDQVNIEVQEGGTITLTPIRERQHPSRDEVSEVIRATVQDYAGTMQRLA